MQKILLSVILAVVMALAVVGVKRMFAPVGAANGSVLVAEGSSPMPTDRLN